MHQPIDDMILVLGIPIAVFSAVLVVKIFEEFVVDCRHDFSEWCSYPDEHAYVQQKQCKKCQFVFTYQERKIGHEQHQHNNVHKE